MPYKNLEDRTKRFKEYHKQFWLDTQAYIQKCKDKPCADCGIKFNYWQMDFDHRPGEGKILTVSQAARTRSRRKVQEEINRCDVVCSNCHRDRTYRRKQWLP